MYSEADSVFNSPVSGLHFISHVLNKMHESKLSHDKLSIILLEDWQKNHLEYFYLNFVGSVSCFAFISRQLEAIQVHQQVCVWVCVCVCIYIYIDKLIDIYIQ